MKKLRFAFAGFRHGHIFGLYNWASTDAGVEVVAACEEHAETRAALAQKGEVRLTHDRIDRMLAEVDCDVVAVGDYYARRGSIEIAAMERGRHIISDKPLCTSLTELGRIEELARAKNLKVGCMLDVRDSGWAIGVRDIVRGGEIGEVHAIAFGGQHPLLLGTRAGWYFEPGKHGGTINDIAIHAVDAIPWITGQRFTKVNAARCWNAFARDFPHFKDAGQFMMTMDNGCGVLGDVSYFSPDSLGYANPLYWRMTFWGRKGVVETAATAKTIFACFSGEKEPRSIALPPGNPNGYAKAFAADVAGRPDPGGLDTPTVLRSSRLALAVQRAADDGLHDVAL